MYDLLFTLFETVCSCIIYHNYPRYKVLKLVHTKASFILYCIGVAVSFSGGISLSTWTTALIINLRCSTMHWIAVDNDQYISNTTSEVWMKLKILVISDTVPCCSVSLLLVLCQRNWIIKYLHCHPGIVTQALYWLEYLCD